MIFNRWLDTLDCFKWAPAFFLFAQACDIASSVVASQFLPGGIEDNPLMRDGNLAFLPIKALEVKTLFFVGFLLPVCGVLRKTFRSWMIASLPLIYVGYDTLHVAMDNVLLFFLPR